jgi:hypothetical protein
LEGRTVKAASEPVDESEPLYEIPIEDVPETIRVYVQEVLEASKQGLESAGEAYDPTIFYLEDKWDAAAAGFMRLYSAGEIAVKVLAFVVVAGMDCKVIFVNVSDKNVQVPGELLVEGGISFSVSFSGEKEARTMYATRLTLYGEQVELKGRGDAISFPLGTDIFPVNKLKEKILRVQARVEVDGDTTVSDALICFERERNS